MRYLLDTHIVLWLAENSANLADADKAIILDETAEKYVSVASCWEVTIKLSLGKLELNGGVSEFFRIIGENGLGLLDISEKHLSTLESLPLQHRDPFDRLLIATAIADDLIFVTHDTNARFYKSNGLRLL